MNRQLLRVAGAALAASIMSLSGGALISGAAAAPSTRGGKAATLRMSVVSVTPSSPVISRADSPLTVVLSFTNLTAKAINNLTIKAFRGEPISSQKLLDESLAGATFPSGGLPEPTPKPVRVSVPADSSTTVAFRTTTSVAVGKGICVCHQAVYPLFFGAYRGSGDTRLTSARTYLPVFKTEPAPVRVSWVWPLIDQPHRSSSDLVFTDDKLSDLVGVGGRLSRSLTVLEGIGNTPVTVLVDPELIDELAEMASGTYTVLTSAAARPVAGVGAPAATAWLSRLRTLLDDHPNVALQFTPYADPDVQTLTERGQSWSTTMPTAMATRVREALGDRTPASTLAWPAATALSSRTLAVLAEGGVRTVLLPSAAVSVAGQTQATVPAGLARLVSDKRTMAAGLLNPTVQKYAADVISNTDGAATAQLPKLVSEIAIRAAAQPDIEHELVITPSRYVDPEPQSAIRAIKDTTTAPYTVGTALGSLTDATRLPATTAGLAKTKDQAGLPGSITDGAIRVAVATSTVASMLSKDVGATTNLVPGFAPALQRAKSSAWRVQRVAGMAFITRLEATLDALTSGVRIVRPSSGSYTLGSSNSPLPITVQNTSGYVVAIQVDVKTQNGLPGFSLAKRPVVEEIQPGGTRTLQLPTKIDRTGRIFIEAQLRAPDDSALGPTVGLTVHSTALGVVGVVITVVAGVVLAVALVIRFARRWRRRPHGGVAPPKPRVPVSAGPAR